MNKILLLAFFMVFSSPLMAQGIDNLAGNNKKPVEISADKTLEWLQNKKQYVANGNVEIKQGDVTIKADKIVADYRDNNKGGNIQIYQVTATGNVTIKNVDSTVTGEKAIYNIDTGKITITGNNLLLITQDQTISATESLEYNSLNGQAKAVGNARIKRAGDTLTADIITADFTKNNAGKQILKTAKANGRIKIVTADETLTGRNGIYNATNNTAEITGNVKIKRGPNTLEGARAQVNLATNVSKMFGAPQSGQRVKAVFFPSSQSSSQKANN